MSFLGNNVKVHFAGSDYQHNCLDSLQMAGVKYRLYTVYPAIVNKNPGDDLTDKTGCARRQEKQFKHVILDSGLFTLMFGGGKEKKQTVQSLLQWQDKLIQFVQQNELNCTCVEIDCQKLLGVDVAWMFRERMRKRLKNRQINVFHWEDGRAGLDRLIEFSDYIALSIPELRIVRGKAHRHETQMLVDYIKNKKPDIDIHLLGCTDKQMLRENREATTSDSSSWTGVYRFANIQGKSAYALKPEIYERYKKMVVDFYGEDRFNSMTPLNKRKQVWELASAVINKQVYEHYAGSQE